MPKKILLPKISDVLKDEFMDPYGISAYTLAKEIHVPVSRIQGVISNKSKITVDMSLRLGRFFGVSDRYFLNIQNDIDIRSISKQIKKEINQINTLNQSL